MAKEQPKDLGESVRRHIDKGKTHHEGNRAGAEKKIQRILELVKNESQRRKRGSKNFRRDSELIGLIEDFQKEHQSLYELCDRLQEQAKSVYGSEAQSSWSFSSLDSEYFSSEEVGSSPRKQETVSNIDELRNSGHVEKDLDNPDVERDQEVTILKKKLFSARQDREALDIEYKKSLSKIEELESTLNELTAEADGRIKELSTLRQEHRALGTKSSARTKELEAQLTSLKVELDALCTQNRDLEGHLKSQATEIRQLKEKNKGLHGHVMELDLISKDRANQISSLMKKIKVIEKETSSTTSELNAQVRSLQFELKTIYAQKCELEETAGRLMDKDKDYSHQLEILHKELNDTASQLESKNKETAEYCKQLESLKEELQLKTGEAQRGMDVNKKLTMKVNDLELEVEALCEHENELEEQLRNRVQETLLLRNEKEGLDAKVVELERSLAEMGNEVSALQDKLKAEKDTYTKSTSMLKTRVVNLQEEVEVLNTQKRKMELRNELERRESPRKAIYVENKGFQLTNKTSPEHPGMLSSDQEDSSVGSRSGRRHRITKHLSPDLDVQLVERKMEEYTEEYRMKIEDNMRILGQRIRVIEHLHLETKESYKENRECIHEGSKMLQECTMSHMSDLLKLKDASIAANDALIWLDLVIRTFEDRSNKIITRVSNAVKELQFIKKAQASNWNSEDEISCQKIDRSQELEVLKESNQDLSTRLDGEVKGKLHLERVVEQLEKKVQELDKLVRERDQGILSVGEEKREAIRQLCFLVDYHRGRCDQYREVILKINGRRRRTN